MNYYYINTEARYLECSPHETWIKDNLAFTSGSETYGEELGKLEPNDICFMYVNKCGVVAVGTVLCHWDGIGYEGDQRIIYSTETEYQIPVDWCIRFVNNPISATALRDIFDWPPRGWAWQSALGPITNSEAAERLLNLAREHHRTSHRS